MNIHVTDHALDRWRERAAEYADAPRSDLRAAFLAASVVGRNEPLPVARLDGYEYRLHAPTGTYFVARKLANGDVALVTVAGKFHNYATGKRRGRKPPR